MPFNRPDDRLSSDTDYIRGPDFGLAEGEWIRYWATLPHSIVARLTTEATEAKIAENGRVVATFDPGAAALARVRLGIVEWNLLDATGTPVAWDPSQGKALVDGLPNLAFNELTRMVGNSVADLAEPAPDQPEGAPLGEGSGPRSGRSSTKGRRSPQR